ncbi:MULTISPECIES: glycosyltransferase family 39 protein [unclassified Leptolyngbya]|uniref:glycosyltransferase family 39 protein n=1 Tax=unclassified Leptolyngbya TaxID=2650499 RepID=UPI001687190D|nr:MULTISPECIES: glycosyltransferase family 39 protein [unclassified Leptolyngbya]MBD1912079.1 glycosyltransferase family 39 protein [Leptolyngbya sp. FACHB-8]MBD2153799.1 glycosyltransferase family 39 protein [Leptolyngbya sp. FACHB-16]
MKFSRSVSVALLHYIMLALIMLVGLGLRFWHLADKPLWLDETITAVFAMGRDYQEVPTGEFVGLEAIAQFFTLNPETTCPTIAQRLIRDSSHPPLFFCLLHQWLVWLQPNAENWIWGLRSLPALFGTGAIAALYLLNRIAFSPPAGLMAAALMAVSPYGVYLSQEARHYTLPILLISLAMLGSVLLVQDWLAQRTRAWVWLGWLGVNVLGLYVHYFFLLALVAQLASLIGMWLLYRHAVPPRTGVMLGLAIALLILGYLPWIPVLLTHFSRPETEWLGLSSGWGYLAPLYQGLVGWIIMLVMLPVERQPLAIAIPLGLLMVAFFFWVALQAFRGWRNFSHQYPTHPALWLITTTTLLILLEYLAIIYVLGKDLTLAPRYNFVYFPGLWALLALALTQIPPQQIHLRRARRRLGQALNAARYTPVLAIAAGLLSSILVVHSLGFYKSPDPEPVAAQILAGDPWQDSARQQPTAIAFHYPTPQELALDLSIALRLRVATRAQDGKVAIAFLPYEPNTAPRWQPLPSLPTSISPPFHFWNFAGPKAPTLPTELKIPTATQTQVSCSVNPAQPNNLFGMPYQRYRCPS